MAKIIKNQSGSTILLMSVLILAGILTVTMAASSIVRRGIIMGQTQIESTKAYFAAEAGAERVLWDVRQNAFVLPAPPADLYGAITLPANNSVYQVDYDTPDGFIVDLTSQGSYEDIHRTVRVSYCVPDCTGLNCGAPNGCGGICPSKCLFPPNFCAAAGGISNATVEPASAGFCCGGDDCYVCDAGFVWDSNAGECVPQ